MEEMKIAKAYLRYVRIAPRKVQIVCDLIRGKDAGTAMANASTMVLKNGFVSRLSIWRETKPMMRPRRPANRLSRSVPPNTGQKPAAAQKLPR